MAGRESELTFLSQLRNLAAGVGMKIGPHVNCEYRYYLLEDDELIKVHCYCYSFVFLNYI